MSINPIPGLELVRDILRDQNFVGGAATITLAIERIQELDPLRQQVQDLKAENERLREDHALLEWAEANPEPAMKEIQSWWATAGAGFREVSFNFSGAIVSAKRKTP